MTSHPELLLPYRSLSLVPPAPPRDTTADPSPDRPSVGAFRGLAYALFLELILVAWTALAIDGALHLWRWLR